MCFGGGHLELTILGGKRWNAVVFPAIFEICIPKNPFVQMFMLLSGSAHFSQNMAHNISAPLDSERHYEQIPSVQKTFLAQTKNVTDVIEELGNPFADTSTDLYNLDSNLIMPDSVVNTAEDTGKAQHQTFVNCGATK